MSQSCNPWRCRHEAVVCVEGWPAMAGCHSMGVTSRRPPAVLYPLRRSRILGLLLVALLLASAGGLGAWLVQSGGAASLWPAVVASILWCLAAASTFHCWFYQFSGVLRWDGQVWTLESPSSGVAGMALSVPPEVLLDVQSYLWLHACPMGRGRIWLWLERSTQPERWLDLRRAVYSRARPGADNADATAPASSRGWES